MIWEGETFEWESKVEGNKKKKKKKAKNAAIYTLNYHFEIHLISKKMLQWQFFCLQEMIIRHPLTSYIAGTKTDLTTLKDLLINCSSPSLPFILFLCYLHFPPTVTVLLCLFHINFIWGLPRNALLVSSISKHLFTAWMDWGNVKVMMLSPTRGISESWGAVMRGLIAAVKVHGTILVLRAV